MPGRFLSAAHPKIITIESYRMWAPIALTRPETLSGLCAPSTMIRGRSHTCSSLPKLGVRASPCVT